MLFDSLTLQVFMGVPDFGKNIILVKKLILRNRSRSVLDGLCLEEKMKKLK